MAINRGHKFAPGQSGNPAGRPRGVKNRVKLEDARATMLRLDFNPIEFLINLALTAKSEKVRAEAAIAVAARHSAALKSIEHALSTGTSFKINILPLPISHTNNQQIEHKLDSENDIICDIAPQKLIPVDK